MSRKHIPLSLSVLALIFSVIAYLSTRPSELYIYHSVGPATQDIGFVMTNKANGLGLLVHDLDREITTTKGE